MIRLFSILFLSFITSAILSGQPTEIVYLSGTGYDNTTTWDFYCSEGMNSGTWSTIQVPSQWEQQGFGAYTYGRYYKNRGEKPSSETGHYKTTFFAPASWKNQSVTIVFEGVMTDTRVLMNGKQAGEIHQGGFYRFSYDITRLVKYNADNQLEVFVSKQSADRSVNAAERMADWWLFGGIYRPVYLEVKPAVHLKDFKTDPHADGTLNASVSLSKPLKKGNITVLLQDQHGKEYPAFEISTEKNQTGIQFTHKWENIEAWNPENPALYNITLQLSENGKPVHSISETIGFRTIEVRPGDGIYCNGVKIILKGINRHTFWPESGRCTSKELSLMDASLIKEMNMNAVRSHYPPDKHFLDACDSLGIFYMDELAGWQNAYSEEIGAKLVKEMIDRDMNHPCIIIWSNGNEGGWNEKTDPLFTKYDPQQREVVHPWADFGNIDTHHYPQYQTGVHRFNNGYRIFLPTETLHSLYDEGSGAGLDDFWSKWTSHPLFAGGFLWAYNDCAIKRTDTGLLDSDGQNAPDGVVGPYREKEGSFFTIREIWSPLQIDPFIVTPTFNGQILVSNHYLYTNLQDCQLSYKLLNVPGPWCAQKEMGVIATGSVKLPSIEPGEKRKVFLDLPDDFIRADVLAITATDRFGKEMYTWTYPVHSAREYLHANLGKTNTEEKASIVEKEGLLRLSGKGTEISFNPASGMIEKIESPKGFIPLNNGPVPVGMKAEAFKYATRQEGNNAILTFWYRGGIDSIRWEMDPAGRLKMTMIALKEARNDGGFDGGFIANQIEHWGITFDYNEDGVAGMRWYGKGPYRVWKNRMKGTTYGLWDKPYNNTITGESFENLVYPEFKGYHANIYWASLYSKDNNLFTVASESDGLFLRLFTPEEPKGSLKPSLPVFPAGDLSFLYEINPIHAFKAVEDMGPQSAPGSIRIKKGDEGISMILWFDFN